MNYDEYLQNKFAYQEEGEQLLVERKHACLFYKMGKGKTYPAITAMREVAINGNCLILSTSDSIKKMWLDEIVPQGILPKKTELLTFTAAIQDKTKPRLLKTHYDCIIIDESHKIKSNSSKISKLCYMLTRKCKYVFGLTGNGIVFQPSFMHQRLLKADREKPLPVDFVFIWPGLRPKSLVPLRLLPKLAGRLCGGVLPVLPDGVPDVL